MEPPRQEWICPSARPVADQSATVDRGWNGPSGFHTGNYGVDFTNTAGSFAINWHFFEASFLKHVQPAQKIPADDFIVEPDVQVPSAAPVSVDAISWIIAPHASDPAPTNLVASRPGFGGGMSMHFPVPNNSMSLAAIPRHGSRPNPVPTVFSPTGPLPGAVNVSFYDGHGEAVRLDNLWQQFWHKDYQPLDKRPGLK
jgi:prepilin-type processing-associated H-X9-DG protein